MDAVQICWATPEHTTSLLPLFHALYRHADPCAGSVSNEIAIDHIQSLLDDTTPHRLAIAWTPDRCAVGLAAVARFVSVDRPDASSRVQVELKELFVREAARGAGVGAALLAWVENHARSVGAHRLDWHVKRENLKGISFYQRQGGQLVEDRLSMRKRLSP